jgi:hypothetical protein
VISDFAAPWPLASPALSSVHLGPLSAPHHRPLSAAREN